MNHYRQATQKRKEEFNNYFLGGIRKGDHLSVESFLDSYAQDIRLAVIEDVRDKLPPENNFKFDSKKGGFEGANAEQDGWNDYRYEILLVLSTLKENPK